MPGKGKLSGCCCSLQDFGLRAEHEFRIAELSHFRKIEAFDLRFSRNALAKDEIENPVERVAEAEDKANQSDDTHELRNQLARITVEQAGNGSSDAVPGATVVACAVSEQANREHAPKSAGAVDRDRADRIIDLQSVLDERNAHAYKQTCYQSDDRAACWVDESARSRDGHEACQHSVHSHRRVRLAFQRPHVDHRAKGTRATRKHGVHSDGANAQAACSRSAERASRIEAEPPEGKDETTDHHGRNVMPDDCICRAIAVEFADARSDDERAGQCSQAAHRMHNT